MKWNAVSEGCNSMCNLFYARFSHSTPFSRVFVLFSLHCMLLYFYPLPSISWHSSSSRNPGQWTANIYFVAWCLRTRFDSAYRSRISHVSTTPRRRIKWALRSIHSLIVLCVHCRSGKGAIKSKLMTFYMSNKGKHFTQFGLCMCFPSSYFVVDLYFYVVLAIAQSLLYTTASFSDGRGKRGIRRKKV